MPTWIWLLVAVIGGVGLYYFLILRPGKLTFWRLASKLPNQAYDWFEDEDCWVITEPGSETAQQLRNEEQFVGPFQLWIPKLNNRRINIFGIADEIEASQERFMDKYSKPR